MNFQNDLWALQFFYLPTYYHKVVFWSSGSWGFSPVANIADVSETVRGQLLECFPTAWRGKASSTTGCPQWLMWPSSCDQREPKLVIWQLIVIYNGHLNRAVPAKPWPLICSQTEKRRQVSATSNTRSFPLGLGWTAWKHSAVGKPRSHKSCW